MDKLFARFGSLGVAVVVFAATCAAFGLTLEYRDPVQVAQHCPQSTGAEAQPNDRSQ